jgi:hypothetical protein
MSKGHVFLAQNSNVSYVTQAYALALSIKLNNKQHNQTCLITNDTVPDDYRHAFDHILDIPWGDDAKEKTWKVENRWKIAHITPFKESLIYDTDMLVLTSNDHWWEFLKNKSVCLTSCVTDYKGRTIGDDYYRKTFTANSLPNVYTGVHYFKKSVQGYEFYKWLEVITKNWEQFYDKFLPNAKQKFCSMDVNAALALVFMQTEHEMTSKVSPLFTHMKPAIQGWDTPPSSWLNQIGVSFNLDKQLKIGNFLQTGVFHYTEDAFLTNNIINTLRY